MTIVFRKNLFNFDTVKFSIFFFYWYCFCFVLIRCCYLKLQKYDNIEPAWNKHDVLFFYTLVKFILCLINKNFISNLFDFYRCKITHNLKEILRSNSFLSFLVCITFDIPWRMNFTQQLNHSVGPKVWSPFLY